MNVVYLVTDGEYEDYHICGVFSTKELAVKSFKFYGIDEGDDRNISEYELDNNLNIINSGLNSYEVYFDNGKNNTGVYLIEYKEPYIYMYEYPSRWINDRYMVIVHAKDKEHAKKVAQDKLHEYLTEREIKNECKL